jgi:plastocyanin
VDGLAFAPRELEVSAGTTVEWRNEDPVQHTVTSGTKGEQGVPGVSEGKPDRADGLFDDELAPGAAFSFTFDKPGTYEYFCRIHGGMTGTVVVD